MCTWGWHIAHCLQPLFIKARCTMSWECKAAQPPAYPHQQLPAFSPAAACSWNCTMQRHDAFFHAKAGLCLTTSFSLLSWEHGHLYGLFLDLPFFSAALSSTLTFWTSPRMCWSQWGIFSGPRCLSLMALGWFCCGLRMSSKAYSNRHIHGDQHAHQMPDCWNKTGNQGSSGGLSPV